MATLAEAKARLAEAERNYAPKAREVEAAKEIYQTACREARPFAKAVYNARYHLEAMERDEAVAAEQAQAEARAVVTKAAAHAGNGHGPVSMADQLLERQRIYEAMKQLAPGSLIGIPEASGLFGMSPSAFNAALHAGRVTIARQGQGRRVLFAVRDVIAAFERG